MENRDPMGDRSRNIFQTEVDFSAYRFINSIDSHSDETPQMVTRIREDFFYCYRGTFSVKQKRSRITSQPHFCSESNCSTIEADQSFLLLHQLRSNRNSVNIGSNINRISKLPESLNTGMPVFDGKSEKFELFEDPSQTSARFHNRLNEDNGIKYFHTLMKKEALQTFKNISSPNWESLGELLTVFRRKNKFQRHVFKPPK